MATGIVEQIVAQTSAANSSQSLQVNLGNTVGTIYVLVAFSAAATALPTSTITDDETVTLISSTGAIGDLGHLHLVGTEQSFLSRLNAATWLFSPTFKATPRPKNTMTVAVAAAGLGITSTITIVAEKP